MNRGLEGSLFVYDEINRLVCFTNNISSDYNLILVGGLSFNLLSLPYTFDLYNFCQARHFGFYIPQFRSHPNYGFFNLDNDIEDLKSLLRLIKGRTILVGNSTGCQVILKYIENYDKNIALCVLQGPVSDVEYERHIDREIENKLEMARNCRGVLPFKHEGNFITGARYLDLFERYGHEDLFNSYLINQFYETKLNPNGNRCVFVLSIHDEFVVTSIHEKLKLVKNSSVYIIKNGDHFLTNKISRKEFIKIINEEIEKEEKRKPTNR